MRVRELHTLITSEAPASAGGRVPISAPLRRAILGLTLLLTSP